MAADNSHNFPELFFPDDARWASRAAARGEIRRLARGLYTPNLDEPAEQLVRRRWYDAAALYFPGAVVVDRSAALAGPASDGSLFLDVGERPVNPRPVVLPGLTLRLRNGPGSAEGDAPFMGLRMSSPARAMLDNLRPSRSRGGVRRTLGPDEVEQRLERLARVRGERALNELRDEARAIAPTLRAEAEFERLDALIGALFGTRDAPLNTPAGRARGAGLAYPRGPVVLEQQQIRQRRLGALDLRGQHRFLANVGVEERLRIGQEGGDPVESSKLLIGSIEQPLQRGGHLQRRARRKRCRMKRGKAIDAIDALGRRDESAASIRGCLEREVDD